MQYKCKNCGGELAYDPQIGKLRCKFCDSVYDLSVYEEADSDVHVHTDAQGNPHVHTHPHIHPAQTAYEEVPEAEEGKEGLRRALDAGFDQATDDSTDIKEDLRLYQCPNCGAEVVTDKSTTATTCVFCSQPLVLAEQMQGEFRPDQIVPFEIDKKKIEELYENYIRTKPFYPEEYSTANVIEKIKGVYLPFWLYSFKTQGDLYATGEQTASFTTQDWIITDHNVFDIYRAGTMGFQDIPVIASARTPRDAMDAIEPYDYSRMKPFSPGYLPGFMAERYDRTEDDCRDAAKERANNTFDNALSSTIGPFSSLQMRGGHLDHVRQGSQYALLPAWVLFMDYKQDEDRLIAINGQTGKIVGNIPVDKRKRNRYFLFWFVLIWIVLLVFSLYVLI